jgi:hypothetical protein
MAWSYSRMTVMIKAVADLGTAIQKFILGTAGSKVMLPDQGDIDLRELSSSHDTGTMWSGDTIPLILGGIGEEIDSAGIVWAHIETNGTGVQPTIRASKGVKSATKNETGLDAITLILEPGYTSQYWCPIVNLLSRTAIIKYAAMNFNGLVVNFYNHDGVTDLTANNQTMFFVGIGQH